MNHLVRSQNLKISESLSDQRLSTHQPSIWFADEDIDESDGPLLFALLEDSFRQWRDEAAAASLADNEIALFDAGGQLAGSFRLSPAEQPRRADKLRQLAVAACMGAQSRREGNAAATPLFKRSGHAPFAALAIGGGEESDAQVKLLEMAALHLRSIFYAHFERLFVRDLIVQQHINDKETERRNTLFQIAERLHDQNEVSSVLQVLLNDLENLYPNASFDLYLSQDHVNGDERVKPLLLRHADMDLHAKAFLEGKPLVEMRGDNEMLLAIPMSGKQAVYGVLSVTMSGEFWDESDMRAFVMLSDTAGSAFENAKLFEQSNLLIGELQLINELTKRLNQSLRLNEIFQFAMTELLLIFKADYCSVLQVDKEKQSFRMMSSNLPAASNEHYFADDGFCGIVYDTKEPLIISDYWSTPVVASKLMDTTGSRSLIAAPIMDGAQVVGIIMVSHLSPNYFSYDNYKLLQVLSTHIGLAITNASLHAEVRRMVITDNLTGLHARHYLNEQIQSRQRKDPYGSLVLVDIDHFKRVNDTYGHQIGDRILIAVSEAIRSCIRESDIAARWGGEELAVYLPQIRAEQAYRIAERIRTRVEQSTDPSVTVSCGLSEWTFEDDKVSVESLFYRADMALYEAKNNGRNRIFVGA